MYKVTRHSQKSACVRSIVQTTGLQRCVRHAFIEEKIYSIKHLNYKTENTFNHNFSLHTLIVLSHSAVSNRVSDMSNLTAYIAFSLDNEPG